MKGIVCELVDFEAIYPGELGPQNLLVWLKIGDVGICKGMPG